MSPADELAAAAEALQSRPDTAALAEWLDFEARLIRRMPSSEMASRTRLALATARTALGEAS